MKHAVELRVSLTEPQAENLQQRIVTLPFRITYEEEQHGARLVVVIGCAATQEKHMREILNDVGASADQIPDD